MEQGRWPIAVLTGLFLLAFGYWLGRTSVVTGAPSTAPTAPAAALDQARVPLTFWLFDLKHQAEYETRRTALEAAARANLTLVQLDKGAHHDALARSFELHAVEPDVAEIEILRAGPLLAPPGGHPSPLLDLTDLLQAGGYLDRFPAGRMAPWTVNGRIHGLPHDIHPCVLLYRKDLYDRFGVDPKQCGTWADFVQAWVAAREKNGGALPFDPLFLSATGSAQFQCLLLQAGADPFDGRGGVTLREPAAAQVLTFYRDLFTRHKLARGMSGNGYAAADYQSIRDGQGVAMIAPDWYLGLVEHNCGDLAGKWAVAPLPAWTPGGRRTSTWGGTMIGISRYSRHPEAAWALVQAAYLELTPEAAAARFRATRILAPDRLRWNDPVFHEATPYFGSQPLGELLAGLADDVPPLHPDSRFGLLRETLDTAVYDVINTGVDPAAALSRAAERLEQKR